MISSYLPILIGNWKIGSLKNSVDPDEMLQNEAFHQCLHCFDVKTTCIFNDKTRNG